MAYHKRPASYHNSEVADYIQISLELHKNKKSFYTGDSVRGQVQINVLQTVFIRELAVEIQGYSHILWHDLDYKENRKDLKIYYKRKQPKSLHHGLCNMLYRQVQLAANMKALPSNHLFGGFQIKIPQDCVSSCEFEFGIVQYELNVICRTSFDVIKHTQKLDITKCSIAKIQRPLQQMKANKHFKLQITLDKTYYQPGDEMKIHILLHMPCENSSYKLGLELKQFITYNHHHTIYNRHGMSYNYDEHLVQTHILQAIELPLKSKLDPQDVSCILNLPNDLVPGTHITENKLLNIHYELQIRCINRYSEKLYLEDEIPIKVEANRSQLDGSTFAASLAENNASECCIIYKKERNFFQWLFDGVLK